MTGLNASTECTPCIGGSYCETQGLTLPTALCDAGYYCKVGAETATPSQGTDANSCPQGMLIISFVLSIQVLVWTPESSDWE